MDYERDSIMKRTTLLAALVLTTIVATTSPVFARRDPGPGAGSAHSSGMPLYNYGSQMSTPPRVGQDGVNDQYADGMNLYEYVRSNPVKGRDPMGLQTTGMAIPGGWSRKQLMRLQNDNLRRMAIRLKSDNRLAFFKKKLRKLCTKKSTDNASKGAKKLKDCCTVETCEKEADAIARAYNNMWEKYAYHPRSFGLTPPPPLSQDNGPVHAGWMCNHWSRFTWEAVNGLDKKKGLKCWKFARAGHVEWTPGPGSKIIGSGVEWEYAITHNWVTATVGHKVAADGKYTVRLDPWNNRRLFIYTEKDHTTPSGAKFKSGYIARGSSKTRRPDRLTDVRVIDPPKGTHDGPPSVFENYWIKFDPKIWPGKTATVGLEKK